MGFFDFVKDIAKVGLIVATGGLAIVALNGAMSGFVDDDEWE